MTPRTGALPPTPAGPLTAGPPAQPPTGAPARGPAELADLAAAAAPTLAGADARDVIAWAAATFGSRWAVASSMQDAVLVHLVAQVAPGTDVLFLDTGFHFPQTLATRDEVAASYAVTVRSLRPEPTRRAHDVSPDGGDFDADTCCRLRKSAPLAAALSGYDAWGSGLRRAEAASRADAVEVAFDAARGIVKVNPLVAWTDADVAAYAARYDVIRNPLLDQGYPSIGCAPCTSPVAPGDDPRSGRWSGLDKTECGIHR